MGAVASPFKSFHYTSMSSRLLGDDFKQLQHKLKGSPVYSRMVFNVLEDYTIGVEMVNDMAAFNPDSYIDGLWGIELELSHDILPRKINELQNDVQRVSIEIQEVKDKIEFIKSHPDLVGAVTRVGSITKTLTTCHKYRNFLSLHRDYLNKQIRNLQDLLNEL